MLYLLLCFLIIRYLWCQWREERLMWQDINNKNNGKPNQAVSGFKLFIIFAIIGFYYLPL